MRFDKLESLVFASLRIVAGLMFATHGAQKLLGWFAPTSQPPFGFTSSRVGGVIELVGGVLIALGLFTRPSAFLAAGTMAVAYIQFHFKLQFANAQWVPAVNKGELSALYCFVFLLIAARGAGPAALDGIRQRRGGGRRNAARGR